MGTGTGWEVPGSVAWEGGQPGAGSIQWESLKENEQVNLEKHREV